MSRINSRIRPPASGSGHFKLSRLSAACALAVAGAAAIASTAEARITRIEVTIRDIAFGGFSFPGVGQYERIVGKAYGEISPTDAHNTPIVDLSLAPRNTNGNVGYS